MPRTSRVAPIFRPRAGPGRAASGPAPAVPVLVFRSARPGRSFEFWLFRKLTPEMRRAALSFAAAFVPRRHISRGERRLAKRHGPGLFELAVTCRPPARRAAGGESGTARVQDVTFSVFFLRQEHTSVVLSSAAILADLRRARSFTPGIREARLCLKELRDAEHGGCLHQAPVLDIFEDVNIRGSFALNPPPSVRSLTAAEPELLALGGLREAVAREARKEGPAAIRELEAHDERFATAAQVLWARLQAGLTQRDLAARAGVRQHQISRIETGSADPTLATLGRLSRALGTELRIGT